MIDRMPPKPCTVPGIVIIPARNEAGSVGNVVREVKSLVDWEVVVVDDASVDDTLIEAQANGAHVLSMPFHVGAWGAVQTGMAYALDNRYQLCVTMDADGQHRAEALPAVTRPVIQGLCDVAIGVCPERVSSARHAAWSLFRCMTGLNLQDVTSGLRAYNAGAMRVLIGNEAAMLNYQDIGVLLMLREAGLHAAEIKVAMGARHNGHSRIYDSWWTVVKYLMETAVLSAAKWQPSWHMKDMFIPAGKFQDSR